MKKVPFIALLVVLAGCTMTEPVYMKNLQTGLVVKCGPYDGRPLQSLASAQRESQCIQDYKEQGFVRVPNSN